MIDIHSHILSGVDDGASGLEVSLALANIYEKAGYRQVVATPHAELDSLLVQNYGENIRIKVCQLNKHFKKHDIDLRVLAGMEVGLDPQLPQKIAQGVILTLADTKYLLVETPFSQLPLNWWDIVFLLSTAGFTAIFAHPERCAQVVQYSEIMYNLLHAGVKFQVNWDSFLGAFGTRAADAAWYMARKGLIHCLATDSHDSTDRHAGNVQKIAKHLAAIIGPDNLKRIAVENPNRVIENKELLEMDCDKITKPLLVKKFKRIYCFTRYL